MDILQGELKIKYHKLAIFFLLTITSLPIIMTTFTQYLLVIVSMSSIAILLITSRLHINYYIIWMVVVGLVILLSITWSLESEWAIGQGKAYLINFSIFVYLSLLIK